MAIRDQLNELLQQFSEELSLDDDDECQIETDDGEECLVSAIEETGQLALAAPLVPLTDVDPFELFREALVINNSLTLTGSARVCYDFEQEMLLLRSATAADGLDKAAFAALLGSFLDLAAEMTSHLQYGQSLTDDGDVEPEKPPIAGGRDPGIIAV